MMLPAFEARWRDALLDATIPAPGDGLPPMAAIDRSAFWPRFDASAPLPLRLGFRASTYLLVALPLVLGYGRPLHRLEPPRRDAALQRAGRVPGIALLLDVVKVVACLAYFDDDGVEARVRGEAAR